MFSATHTTHCFATVCYLADSFGLQYWSLSLQHYHQITSTIFVKLSLYVGHVVAQLAEALHYKPKGRGFESRWCHWNFSLTYSFRPRYGSGLTQPPTEMSTRNIFWGKGGRCVGMTTLPPSRADCLEIWEPQSPGTLRACPGL